MMTLSDRVRLLIEVVTPPSRRFVALEEDTGVRAETWRTWWNRGGKASADMIDGVSKRWPEYAFWIASGWSDTERGHLAPNKAEAVKIKRASVITAVK